MSRQFCKDDIEFHSDGYRAGNAAINIKVYSDPRRVPLPLDLGSYRNVGETEWHKSETDYRFTWDWIDEHLTEEQLNEWWWLAANNNLEMVLDYAKELFLGEKFHTEGRSGGWLVMDRAGSDVVASWGALMVSKWGRLAKYARAAADDVNRTMLDLIYFNVFVGWLEEQEQHEQEVLRSGTKDD